MSRDRQHRNIMQTPIRATAVTLFCPTAQPNSDSDADCHPNPNGNADTDSYGSTGSGYADYGYERYYIYY